MDLIRSSLVAIAAVACTATNGALTQSTSAQAIESDAGVADVSPPHDVCADPLPTTRAELVCRRYTCERDLSPAIWSGDAAKCAPGTIDPEVRARALRFVNFHRYLADLPPLAIEPSWEPAAAECALLAHANGKLSHDPPKSWRCWSELGAKTSAVSLVANRSASAAMEAYFEDPGNETTMVHRRWLLSGALSTIAIGSTDRYSCVMLEGPRSGKTPEGDATRTWAAWPPPGPVPIALFENERLDTMGWTLQSDEDLGDARVTVTVAGVVRRVVTSKLEPRAGSRSAVRFVPDGWKTEAGKRYEVRVRGDVVLDYAVEPIACEP